MKVKTSITLGEDLLEAIDTVVCAPVYSQHDGPFTQVPVGADEGLKHDTSIHCTPPTFARTTGISGA